MDHVNLVINIGLPKDTETYLHRVGRTGRFGTFGVAVTLIDSKNLTQFAKLCTDLNITIPDLPDEIPHDTYVYELTSTEDKTALAKLKAHRDTDSKLTSR